MSYPHSNGKVGCSEPRSLADSAERLKALDKSPAFGITLTKTQQSIHDQILIDVADDHVRTACITGYAGVGKTVTTAAIVHSLQQEYGRGVELCATTHKAARQVERGMADLGVVGSKAITIHRLLGVKQVRDYQTGEEYFTTDKQNPPQLSADTKVVVLDETSMLPRQLYNCLLDAIGHGQTVVFVGDDRQLAPPSDNKLCDAFTKSDRSYRLTEVLRHDGAVLQLATATRQMERGRGPFIDAQGGGSRVITYPSIQSWKAAAIQMACSPEAMAEPDYTRILAFTNNNVKALNRLVRERVFGIDAAPYVPGERLISHSAIPNPNGGPPVLYSTAEMLVQSVEFDAIPLDGDEIKDVAVASHGVRKFNKGLRQASPWQHWRIEALVPGIGPIEFCVLDAAEKDRWRKCQKAIAELANSLHGGRRRNLWRLYFYRRDQFGAVEPASALTIHKSQGSTYRHVFLHPDVDGFPNSNGDKTPSITTNRLAYVGITRAAETLHVVADSEVQS